MGLTESAISIRRRRLQVDHAMFALDSDGGCSMIGWIDMPDQAFRKYSHPTQLAMTNHAVVGTSNGTRYL